MKTEASIRVGKSISATENRTVALKRPKNEALRSREHLTPGEIELLMRTARSREGRYGHRDATMILACYRHVLRVGELCGLRWDQFDFEQGLVHVRRLKNGRPSVHPIRSMEMLALRRLKREQVPASPYVFTGFTKLLARVREAGMPFPILSHTLSLYQSPTLWLLNGSSRLPPN